MATKAGERMKFEEATAEVVVTKGGDGDVTFGMERPVPSDAPDPKSKAKGYARTNGISGCVCNVLQLLGANTAPYDVRQVPNTMFAHLQAGCRPPMASLGRE